MSCGKRILKLKEAQAAIKQVKKSRRDYRKEKRFYYCDVCNGWHLTSMEYKEEPEPIKLIEQDRWEKLLSDQN